MANASTGPSCATTRTTAATTPTKTNPTTVVLERAAKMNSTARRIRDSDDTNAYRKIGCATAKSTAEVVKTSRRKIVVGERYRLATLANSDAIMDIVFTRLGSATTTTIAWMDQTNQPTALTTHAVLHISNAPVIVACQTRGSVMATTTAAITLTRQIAL
jgi:hypothetical protein